MSAGYWGAPASWRPGLEYAREGDRWRVQLALGAPLGVDGRADRRAVAAAVEA